MTSNSSNEKGYHVSIEKVNLSIGDLTYQEAFSQTLNLFSENFLRLQNQAGEIAKARATEITELFLKNLFDHSPNKVQELGQPGIQAALYQAQKSYAISGRKESAELLCQLLLARIDQPKNSTLQVTLDEALMKVDKLTNYQLDLILLIFILHNRRVEWNTMASLTNYVLKELFPLAKDYHISSQVYDHLDYLNLIRSNNRNDKKLAGLLISKDPKFFSGGFSMASYEKVMGAASEDYKQYLTQAHFYQDLYQFSDALPNSRMFHSGDLKKFKAGENGISQLIEAFVMEDQSLHKFISDMDFQKVQHIDKLLNSPFKYKTLTPVGLAIALAHFSNTYKETLKFSNYISTDDMFEMKSSY